MKKLILLTTAILIFLTVFPGITSAYGIDRVFTQMLGTKSILYADWQMDYLLPLNPDELNKGDYRFTANIGRFEPNLGDDLGLLNLFGEDSGVNNFYLALDTGISDNLYMRLSMDYVPDWDVGNDYDVSHNVYNIYFDYKTENDNSLYFGYNRFKVNGEYTGESTSYEDEDVKVNYYFVGYEMRGSFLGDND